MNPSSDTILKGHGDVGTAFLVLSHAAWVGTSIACTSIAIALIIFALNRSFLTNYKSDLIRDFRNTAQFACLASFVLGLWTYYAIERTWKSSEAWPAEQRIFGDTAFYFLLLINTVVVALNFSVWWFARRRCVYRKPKNEYRCDDQYSSGEAVISEASNDQNFGQ